MRKARRHAQPTAPTHVVQAMHAGRSRAGSENVSHLSYTGNQAVLRRLSPALPRLQCKLEIGAVNDPLEAEADRVADQVMRMPDPVVRKKCAECEEEDARKLHTKSNSQSRMERPAPPIVHQVLNSSGQPLDAQTRAFFEPRFGSDFSQVRVHKDDHAAESARAVSARAYTVGNDIVFGQGQYLPFAVSGKKLIAHELSHTVQQAAGCHLQCQRDEQSHDQNGNSQDPSNASQASDQGLNPSQTANPQKDPDPYTFPVDCVLDKRLPNFAPNNKNRIAIDANLKWSADCGNPDIWVNLKKVETLWDSTIDQHKMKAGEGHWDISITELGVYYLEIHTLNTNPICCLTGSISYCC